ncbi:MULTISPECIES: hypothetical protein [unclassified Pseudomonas]|nr:MULTISPECIES: hypothetical protein [unclassified Pseudomonas]
MNGPSARLPLLSASLRLNCLCFSLRDIRSPCLPVTEPWVATPG